MEYQPKTAWLKRQIAKKNNTVRTYNVAESDMQRGQVKHLQQNPSSRLASKIVNEINADVTAYIRDKNKARGTDSSAKRVPVK